MVEILEPVAYGYFGSVEDLQEVIEKRRGNEKPLLGAALVFLGAKVVNTGTSIRLLGEPTAQIAVRVLPGGELDIRPRSTSWDNE